MTKIPATFAETDIFTIIPKTGVNCNKTDTEISYLEKKIIYEAICQKLRKNDVYKTDMHKICNLTLGQTNKQLQDKMASDTTFKVTKTSRYPFEKICFSNESK